jgi:hypothetical protein
MFAAALLVAAPWEMVENSSRRACSARVVLVGEAGDDVLEDLVGVGTTAECSFCDRGSGAGEIRDET